MKKSIIIIHKFPRISKTNFVSKQRRVLKNKAKTSELLIYKNSEVLKKRQPYLNWRSLKKRRKKEGLACRDGFAQAEGKQFLH